LHGTRHTTGCRPGSKTHEAQHFGKMDRLPSLIAWRSGIIITCQFTHRNLTLSNPKKLTKNTFTFSSWETSRPACSIPLLIHQGTKWLKTLASPSDSQLDCFLADSTQQLNLNFSRLSQFTMTQHTNDLVSYFRLTLNKNKL
jgi:hypothetical protein